MPDFFLALGIAPGAHLIVHAVGGTAQRQLAKGNQITFAEKILDGAFGLPGKIDLSFVQALAQIVRGKVDEHHLIGGIKKGVRHRFAHLNAGYAADDVVEAFQVLNVNGGENIDARLEQLINVLPALRVARAGRIAVR